MPAFTKGKWSYADVSTPYEQHFIIGTVDKTGTFYAHASTKTEADARLFAAAPELYEAVCDLLDYAYEALHWAGEENEIHGKAPRILRDIQEYQELLVRIDGKEATGHDTDA